MTERKIDNSAQFILIGFITTLAGAIKLSTEIFGIDSQFYVDHISKTVDHTLVIGSIFAGYYMMESALTDRSIKRQIYRWGLSQKDNPKPPEQTP